MIKKNCHHLLIEPHSVFRDTTCSLLPPKLDVCDFSTAAALKTSATTGMTGLHSLPDLTPNFSASLNLVMVARTPLIDIGTSRKFFVW